MDNKYSGVAKDDIGDIQNLDQYNNSVIIDHNDQNPVEPEIVGNKINKKKILYYLEIILIVVIMIIIIICPIVDIYFSRTKLNCIVNINITSNMSNINNITSNMSNIVNFVEDNTEIMISNKLLMYGLTSLGTTFVFLLYCAIIASKEILAFQIFKCFHTIQFYKISLIFINMIGFTCSVISCFIFHTLNNFFEECDKHTISNHIITLSLYILFILNIFFTILCGTYLIIATYKILQIVRFWILSKN